VVVALSFVLRVAVVVVAAAAVREAVCMLIQQLEWLCAIALQHYESLCALNQEKDGCDS
jgi:hypothetical protein